MPSFPRDVQVQQASPAVFPGALQAWSESGKGQVRSVNNAGRIWTERYQAFQASTAANRAWLETVHRYWQAGTIFDIAHPLLDTNLGVGGGTPLVKGASQTGSSITIDGATASVTNWLRQGDVIKFAGDNLVYDVTADVNTDGIGEASIPISPPIFTGNAPADNAAVTISSVTFRAILFQPPPRVQAAPQQWIVGYTLTFREMP